MTQMTRARTAGALWLAVIVTGLFGYFVGATRIVRGDAAATAANILASEGLYRAGFASNLAAGICYMGVTAILYDLLKSVSRTRSMLAACFGVAGVAVGAATVLADLAPLVLLRGGAAASTFTPAQLQALAYAALGIGRQFIGVGMVFFGCQCILVGALLARSTLVPQVLGVLLAIGGSSYVIDSFATFLWPAAGVRIAPFILPAGLLGEGSLTLWLLLKGVRPLPVEHHAARVA